MEKSYQIAFLMWDNKMLLLSFKYLICALFKIKNMLLYSIEKEVNISYVMQYLFFPLVGVKAF
jgi:hypothetical protein